VPIGFHNVFLFEKTERHASINKPVEACAVCRLACKFRDTGRSLWRKDAWSAFNWFLGDNEMQIALYYHTTGGRPGRFVIRLAPMKTRCRSDLSF